MFSRGVQNVQPTKHSVMNKVIIEQLHKIEKENDVKILYAMESGSRGWGFESKDSDFDVRFIYVHNRDWYLKVFEGRDIIEIPVDKVLDINGWDLKKALQLMYKSNPPLLEWLSSPVVYQLDTDFLNGIRELASLYFKPVHTMYHYVSLGKKTFKGISDSNAVKLKKLFYVIRPVFSCMWVDAYMTIPPMNLQEMMEKLKVENHIKKEIEKLVVLKAGCTEEDTIPSPMVLMEFLRDKLDYFEDRVKDLKDDKNRDTSSMDEFFCKVLEG